MSDEATIEAAQAALVSSGAQPAQPTSNGNRGPRHTIQAGRDNRFRETYNGSPILVSWLLNTAYLVSAAFRAHRAASSGDDMFAFRADILVDGVIGTVDSDGNVTPHPLYADTDRFPYVPEIQHRVRVQNFVKKSHVGSLRELFMLAAEAGSVVNLEPTKRENRQTVDLMSMYAPGSGKDAIVENALALRAFEMSVNPLTGTDGNGYQRQPFVSLIDGLDNQGVELAGATEIPPVIYLNGRAVIPQSEARVPKPFDCGVFDLADGRSVRLYGALPASVDAIAAKFAALSGDEAVASAPAAPLTAAQVVGSVQTSTEVEDF